MQINDIVEVTRMSLLSAGRRGRIVGQQSRDGRFIVQFADGFAPKQVGFKEDSLTVRAKWYNKEEQGTSRFIVVRTKGKTRPNEYKIHPTEEEAKEEAIRLAKSNPNIQFTWLEIKGSVTNKQKVVNELEIV